LETAVAISSFSLEAAVACEKAVLSDGHACADGRPIPEAHRAETPLVMDSLAF
jgi:hypothetical protein